jgi:hypothetical protein
MTNAVYGDASTKEWIHMIDISTFDVNTSMAEAREEAGAAGKKTVGKTFGLLLSALQTKSGGDEYLFEVLAGRLLDQITGSDFAQSDAAGADNGGLLGNSSKKDDSVDPETARKLAIADKLILVSGGLDGAEKNAAAYTTLLGDTQLRKFLFQTQTDVASGKVFVMTDADEPSRVILSNHHKTEQMRDKYRDAFEALLSELFGHVPGGDVSKQKSAGLTKVTDLQSGSTSTTTPTEDQILAKLVALTGEPKKTADEKLADYVTRVTTSTGGNAELKLYDQIASMIAFKRPAKQADDAYRAAVMTELGNFATAYTTTWNELVDAANHNKMDLTGNPNGATIAKWLGTNLYALVEQVDKAREIVIANGVPSANINGKRVEIVVGNLVELVNSEIKKHYDGLSARVGGKAGLSDKHPITAFSKTA